MILMLMPEEVYVSVVTETAKRWRFVRTLRLRIWQPRDFTRSSPSFQVTIIPLTDDYGISRREYILQIHLLHRGYHIMSLSLEQSRNFRKRRLHVLDFIQLWYGD